MNVYSELLHNAIKYACTRFDNLRLLLKVKTARSIAQQCSTITATML
jgi:two-component sensor histidine kinase